MQNLAQLNGKPVSTLWNIHLTSTGQGSKSVRKHGLGASLRRSSYVPQHPQRNLYAWKRLVAGRGVGWDFHLFATHVWAQPGREPHDLWMYLWVKGGHEPDVMARDCHPSNWESDAGTFKAS